MKTQVTLGNVNDCFMFANYRPLTFGRIFIFQCMLLISEFSLDILPKNPYFCFEMKGNVVIYLKCIRYLCLGWLRIDFQRISQSGLWIGQFLSDKIKLNKMTSFWLTCKRNCQKSFKSWLKLSFFQKKVFVVFSYFEI